MRMQTAGVKLPWDCRPRRPPRAVAVHRFSGAAADLPFCATWRHRARVPSIGSGDDTEGWQDWPPDESAGDALTF
jgi:hypothetical protein